jgi:hypothetical protein
VTLKDLQKLVQSQSYAEQNGLWIGDQ